MSFVPMPVYNLKKWNYSEETYNYVKNNSFASFEETLEYFNTFTNDIASLLKIETEDIEIKQDEHLMAQIYFEKFVIEIKHFKLSKSIESSKLRVYDWFDEDVFRIGIIGGKLFITFDAVNIRNRNYIDKIITIVDNMKNENNFN